MFRLRTTSGLSALALVIGIAGTYQLSTWTSDWQGPASRVAMTHAASGLRHNRAAARRHLASSASSPQRHNRPAIVPYVVARSLVSERAPAPAAPPELVPLSMPADMSQPWEALRGHLDGRVVLHVQIDGDGRVSAASIVESSGDAVLDEHALRGVRGWRFAVPAGQPNGMSGNLPMRFSSHGDAIASVP